MKILLINKFLYPKGGDAICTLDTGSLLRRKGHEVLFWGMRDPQNPSYRTENFFVDNKDYSRDGSLKQQIVTACNLIYSMESKRKIRDLIKNETPDIVHLHNFAHQISPSILDVLKKYAIPCVMTMHDYKMTCPSYRMLTKGKLCERCKGGRFYWCTIKKCTKNSVGKSLLNTVEMYCHHRLLHIYDHIQTYISPSRFLAEKTREMGLKGNIVHLPNFIDPLSFSPRYSFTENTISYVGRLSFEKGLMTLIRAMKGLNTSLKIIGDGPMRKQLEKLVDKENLHNIHFLGYRPASEVKSELRKSMFMVIPSAWYENNPKSVIEAFALGKPVVGARIGGIPELVKEEETGLTFQPGNADDLRHTIELMLKDETKILEMGKKARRFVEEELTPEVHYKSLLRIYDSAISNPCPGRL